MLDGISDAFLAVVFAIRFAGAENFSGLGKRLFIQLKVLLYANLAVKFRNMSDGKRPVRREALHSRNFPLFIKYMGSKSRIIEFVVEGIQDVYKGDSVCDLFAGACNLSGAIGNQVAIKSNDIQAYSAILAKTFQIRAREALEIPHSETVLRKAARIVTEKKSQLGEIPDSSRVEGLQEFKRVEAQSREFLHVNFPFEYHLFFKTYSGTWWSPQQCLWIDSLREVADSYGQGSAAYHAILSSLMYGMAYSSQGTGHYAQWREPDTLKSMRDIQIYRRRSLPDYFGKKLDSLLPFLSSNDRKLRHETTTLDYKERLKTLGECTVYADPPYCFVHYSRFYHALETLVRYDYPQLQTEGGTVVKGRYRDDRHQSPFCIRSQVAGAFAELFAGIARSGSNLVLSYSKTALIPLDRVVDLAKKELGRKYSISLRDTHHKHMTMGRRKDRDRAVTECLLLAEC